MKRELVALLLLSYGCLATVNVLRLFLTVPWVGLCCVIVVFPDHSQLLFYLRRLSESRSSGGSSPSVCLSVCQSVRLSATLLGCLVCVICNSKTFHSFLFKLFIMIVHTLKVCTFYVVHISWYVLHFWGSRT